VRPFLDPLIVSGTLHVYVSQTDRGELVFGASVDPFASYSMRGSLDFIEGLAGHVLELMPSLAKLRVLRQWAGLCDMTPDFAPIMGPTPVPGFLLDVGWGTYGFKAGPVSGESMAELIATGKTPKLIQAFGLDRFEKGNLVGEKGAAAVGHGARESGVVFSPTPWSEATHDPAALPVLRAAQRFGVPLRRRAVDAPRPERDRRRGVEGLPVHTGQPGGLDDGDLVS